MAKKMRRFDSTDSFLAWADAGNEKCFEDGTYIYVPVLVDNGWKISADFATDCAKPETAVKRFFRAFSEVPELAEWEETLMEYLENNVSHQGYDEIGDDGSWSGAKTNNTGGLKLWISIN